MPQSSPSAGSAKVYVPPVYPDGVDARALVVTKVQDCDGYVRAMGEVARSLRGQE